MTHDRPIAFDTPEPSRAHGHSREAKPGQEYEGGRGHAREGDATSENIKVSVPPGVLMRLIPTVLKGLAVAVIAVGSWMTATWHNGSATATNTETVATDSAAILARIDALARKVDAEPQGADSWQARTILSRLDKLEAQVGTLNASMAAYSATMTAMAAATEKAIDRLDRANDSRRIGR